MPMGRAAALVLQPDDPFKDDEELVAEHVRQEALDAHDQPVHVQGEEVSAAV